MKVLPKKSLDINEIFNNLEKKSEDESDIIKGININAVVNNYLRVLNTHKSTSADKSKPRTNIFSVSQSSYDCYRKIYYEMRFPRQSDESKLGVFTMGDIIDDIMKGAFGSIGATVNKGCGKSYHDGLLRIQGSTDAEFPDLVIEVKSVSPFAWKYIVGGKDRDKNIIVGKPKIQHVRQLNTYMDIKGIENGVLVYVNKDNFSIKTYPVKHSKEMMGLTLGRVITVYNSILKSVPPDRYKCDECAYCGHTDMCKESIKFS